MTPVATHDKRIDRQRIGIADDHRVYVQFGQNIRQCVHHNRKSFGKITETVDVGGRRTTRAVE